VLYRSVLLKWGADLWQDPNYSHGLLIPFISWYILREKLKGAEVGNHCWSGLAVVILALSLFMAGYMGAEFFTKRISFIILLFGAILLLEGRKMVSRLSFPVGLLFLAVPLPYVLYNSIAFPLKMLASRLAVFLLGFLGMPVFLEGNVISLPHTTLQVVDACSGIRSLMTLFTLAFLLAYFHHKRFWKRFLVCLLTIPVAVGANAVRVAITGILTQYSKVWSAGFWHEFEGWVVFVVSFAGLAFCSYLLKGRRSS
jgi:exosortase